jgi:hypothetical protein
MVKALFVVGAGALLICLGFFVVEFGLLPTLLVCLVLFILGLLLYLLYEIS